MRKQYTFLLAMLLGLLGFSVNATSITFHVAPEGSTVRLMQYDYSDVLKEKAVFTAGSETLDLTKWSYYYLVAEEGQNILSVTDKSGKEVAVNDLAAKFGFPEGTKAAYISVSSVAQEYTITTDAGGGDTPEPTEGVSFLLQNGSAKIYLFENCTTTGTFVTDLTVGETKTLEFVNAKSYAIVPGDGLTLTVTDKDGNESWIQDAEYGKYGVDYVTVDGWTANTYTITTKDAPVKADSYDVTFNITGGDKLDIVYYDYTTGSWPAPLVTLATVTNGQKVTLKADEAFYAVSPDGYNMVSVTDADGNNVALNTYSMSKPCLEIHTGYVPSSAYNVTLKSTATGTKFTLAAGSSASIWYFPGGTTCEKIQDLVEGDNLVNIPEANYYDYYIVANNAGDDLKVIYNGTQELYTFDPEAGMPGKYASLKSDITGEYVITTTAPATMSTVMNLAAGSKAKIQYNNPLEMLKVLAEGDNNIVFPQATTYYILGDEGHNIKSVTDADGNALTILSDNTFGQYAYLNLSSTQPSSRYTIVTEEPKPTGNPLVILTAGSQAYYTDSDNNRHELVEGNNYLDMGSGFNWGANMWKFYPADGHKFTSFIDADGNEQTINAEGYVEISPKSPYQRSTQYTITTEAEEAPANNLTVIVDDASKVYFANNSWKEIALENGENNIEITETYRYILYAKGGGYLYSVTLDGTPLEDQSGMYYIEVANLGGKTLDIKANYPDENWTYTLESTGDPIEWRRAAIADLSGNLTDVQIVNNTITAKAGSEIRLWAKDADNYDKNATTVSATGKGNEYCFWMNNGDPEVQNTMFTISEPNGKLTINAVANTPVEEKTNFHLTDGSAAAIWKFVSPTNITKWMDLEPGDNMITLPTDAYYYIVANEGATLKVTDDQGQELTTFNNTLYFTGPFVAATDVNTTRFDITTTGGAVEPIDPDMFEITLTVDNPEYIKVYTYYSAYDENACKVLDVQLTAGSNTIKVPYAKDFNGNNRDWAQIWIGGANHECTVNSVKYRNAGETDWWNGSDDYGTGVYEIYAYPKTEVTVEATRVSYANSCEVYTDRGSQTTIKLVSKDGREITLQGGINTVWFNTSENDFTVQGPSAVTVFVNGTQISGNTVTLAEGDLIKIFAGPCDPINFEFVITPEADDCPVKVVNVKTDGRNDVEDLSKALELLPGTEVTFEIEAPEDVKYTVTMGEDALTPDANGVYTVWPTTDSNVTITYKAPAPAEVTLALVTEEGETAFTKAEGAWTLSLDKLAGSFRVKSSDGSVDLGSNGSPVELNVAYTATEGAAEGMTLACGEATEVTISIDAETMAITISGTAGIVTIARDQLDMKAIYFDMAGRRIAATNVENGFYIQVANGAARKIAVK